MLDRGEVSLAYRHCAPQVLGRSFSNSHLTFGQTGQGAQVAARNADHTDVLQTQRDAATGYPALASALWRQREAMQLLARALAGRGEVRAALDDFRLGEVFRAAEAEELARAVGLPADITLADLAAASAEPWRTLLTDHWDALHELYTEITARAAAADVRIWQQSLDDFLR
jgi:hypothetical protein